MSTNDKMRLWVQERGWRGCVVAIALTEGEARRQMAANSWNYSEESPLIAFDLDAGYKHTSFGDQ